MVQLKLSKHHNTAIELCYKKQHNQCLLYDDSNAPRLLIATISGNDLDGWTWQADSPTLADYWQEQTHFKTWRAAMVTAALGYINLQNKQ
jgi:hypothetical protein